MRWLYITDFDHQNSLAFADDGRGDNESVPRRNFAGAVEQFPVEVLPAPIQKIVTAAAEALHCPVDSIAVPSLAAAGSAIGTSCVVEIQRGWTESAALFTTIIASPGSKKTPALKIASTPHSVRQTALYRAFKQKKEEYRIALAQYDIDLAQWKKDAAKGNANTEEKPEEPKEPVLEQVFTTDATTEALASLNEQNPRGVAYICDELSTQRTKYIASLQ